ncbi:DUF4130 domain-containing protein [Dendrosporobacter sp. 1207_IL3150]|uniref:DUF4130 domain-containing protein n=1 Tax=Dendrosporobacter sp. 1207_IL3150 TaxID=3084054 RepID=UPI002FD8A1EC
MILCSPTPISIIKAAMLAEIHNDLPCLKGDQESLGLFMFTSELDADNTTLPVLIEKLNNTCGLNANWLLSNPGKILTQLISANLRYQSNDKTAVIFAAIEQAIRYGHVFCFTGAGDISKLFRDRSKAVSHEIHRMLGFVRFRPAANNTLIAQPKLFHNTADIILRRFALRYPNTRLVIVLDDQALVLDNNILSLVPSAEFSPYLLASDTFSKTWETYYQAQYLATRKNIHLAERAIPKKYWSWLNEGQYSQKESSS